jgi:hypothetical protein
MADRIKRKHSDLLDQVGKAIEGITGLGAGWPAAAPSLASVTAHHGDFETKIADTETKYQEWRSAVAAENAAAVLCTEDMRGIDEATDMLVGPTSPDKLIYGLDPKGSPIEALAKLVTINVYDGQVTGSLLFDWENIEGATYEVQWFSDSALTQMVGSATSTRSDFVIGGLTPGDQYWMRVRPHRGGQTAPWSDPATRVAPL